MKIDGGLKSLGTKLTAEAKKQLEANLIADGCCLEALVVWAQPPDKSSSCECKGGSPGWEWQVCSPKDMPRSDADPQGSDDDEDWKGWRCQGCGTFEQEYETVLLDGHNRIGICDEHGIEYRTVAMHFPDRLDAEDWIDKHQLGRRNENADQQSLRRGRINNRKKKRRGGQAGNQNAKKRIRQNDVFVLANTTEVLAKEFGVSPKTIERDGQFADAVEVVRQIDPDIEAKVAQGEAPPKATVIEAAKLVEDDPEQAKELLQPKPKKRKKVSRKKKGKSKQIADNTDKPFDIMDAKREAREWFVNYMELVPKEYRVDIWTTIKAAYEGMSK